jgi:hypothetical protein
MVWHDEFTGDVLDTAKWTQPGWHVQNVDTNPGNAWVEHGQLALNLSSPTSGALVRSRFGLLPGMVAEAWVMLPGSDTGDQVFNFPAWWAAGFAYPASGEHDIAEGLKRGLSFGYWDRSKTKTPTTYPPGDWNGWHVFTLVRGFRSATVYWDGAWVGHYATNDDGGPEALILSLGAPSADWGQAPVVGKPGRVWVDYVRVWSR